MANGAETTALVTVGQNSVVQLSLGNPDFCEIPQSVLYETASSFIAPTADHKRAYQLVQDRLNASGDLLMVVGHTDDVGSASSNVPLSERRARGALAVLAGNTAEWESNFVAEHDARTPSPWGEATFTTMLVEVGATPASAPDMALVRRHLARTTAGAALRATLFGQYFQKLLGSPSTTAPVNTLVPGAIGCGEAHALAPGNHAPSRRAEFFFKGSSSPLVRCDDYPTWHTPCAPIPLPPPAINAFFISGSGDDATGTGTAAQPWRTFKHALEQIAILRKPGEHIALNVLGGHYVESVEVPSELTIEGVGTPLPQVRLILPLGKPVIVFRNVRNSSVKNLNISGGANSGVRVEDSRGIEIRDCEIVDNFAPRGGGVAMVRARNVTIENNTIERNQGGSIATAITALDIDATVTGNLGTFDITIGHAHGGGVYVENSDQVTIRTNRIRENRAILFGGGIAVDNRPDFAGAVEIVDNEITCNQVSHGGLGALGANVSCAGADMGDPVRTRMAEETFDRVAAAAVGLLHGGGVESGLGGGVALRHAAPATRLAGNFIGVDRAGGAAPNRARRGGGIECFTGAYPHVENNRISFNLSSDDGGGIAIDQFDPILPAAQPALPFAGFVRRSRMFPRQTIRLVGNQIRSNRCIEDGGGLYATGNPHIEISGATVFQGNRAGQNGGAIRVSYAAILNARDARIEGNQANVIREPDADSDAGGGVAARNSSVTLERCVLSGNVVERFAGGAIFFNSAFEGGFDEGGFIENQRGQFDEIMEQDYGFTTRHYEVADCSGSDNEARGNSGAGGFLYAVRDPVRGGSVPMAVLLRGAGTAIGVNRSEYNNAANPGGAPQKRGNVVIELSGHDDGAGRPQDRATVFGDVPAVPTGVALSTPTPDEKAVLIIHHDGRADDRPTTFPYQNTGPLLLNVLPNLGGVNGGTATSVTGQDFMPGAEVRFAGALATNINFVSTGELGATTPAGSAGPADVELHNPDGQISGLSGGFEYVVPTISSLDPDFGAVGGGTPVTLSGSGLLEGAEVFIGSNPALISVVVEPTEILLTTPGSPTGAPQVVDVSVVNPDGSVDTVTGGFEYVAPPDIFIVAPPVGPAEGGTTITIDGSNFRPGVIVLIGGNSATAVTLTPPNRIEAETPAGAVGPADVEVRNRDGQLKRVPGGFTYLAPPPSITSVTPGSGPSSGGTPLTITGTDFQPGATVTIGGQPDPTATVVLLTEIDATAPPLLSPIPAGPADVVVRNPDDQTATLTGGYVYL